MVQIPQKGLSYGLPLRTALHGYPKDEEEEEEQRPIPTSVGSGGFLDRVVGSALDELLRPIQTYGQTLAESLYQGTRYVTDPTFRKAMRDPESITEDERKALETSPETRFLSSEQMKDRGQIAKTGLASTVQSMATVYGAPKILTRAGLTTAAFGAGLGGGISAVTGQDVAAGVGRGVGQTPSLLGYIRATDPTIHKTLAPFIDTPIRETLRTPVVKNIASRAASGAMNVLQGRLIDQARQQDTTPAWQMLDFVTGATFGKGQFRPWVDAKGRVDPDLFGKYISNVGARIEEVGSPIIGRHMTTPEIAKRIKRKGFKSEATYGKQDRYVFAYAPGTEVPKGVAGDRTAAVDIDLTGMRLLPVEAGKIDVDLPKGYDGYLATVPQGRTMGGSQYLLLKADVADKQLRTEMAEEVLSRTMANVVKANIAGYLPSPSLGQKQRMPRRPMPEAEPYLGQSGKVFKFMDKYIGKEFAPVEELYNTAKNAGKVEKAAIQDALLKLPDDVFTTGKGATKKITTKKVTKAVKKYDPETKTLTEISPQKIVESVEMLPTGKVAIKQLIDYVNANWILPTRMRLGQGWTKAEIEHDGDKQVREMLNKIPAYRDAPDDFDVQGLFFRPKYMSETAGSKAVVGKEKFPNFYTGYNNEPHLDIFEDHNLKGSQNMGFLGATFIHEWLGLEDLGDTLQGIHSWGDYTKAYGGHTRLVPLPGFKLELYLDQLPKEMQINPEELKAFGKDLNFLVNEIQYDSAQGRKGQLSEMEKISPVMEEVGMRRAKFAQDVDYSERMEKHNTKLKFLVNNISEVIRRTVNKESLEYTKVSERKYVVRNKSAAEVKSAFGKRDLGKSDLRGATMISYDQRRNRITPDLTREQAAMTISRLEEIPKLGAKYMVGEFEGDFAVYRRQPSPQVDVDEIELASGKEVTGLQALSSSDLKLFKAEPKVVDESFRSQKAAQEYIDERSLNDKYIESLADKYVAETNPKVRKFSSHDEVMEEAKSEIREFVDEIEEAIIPGEGIRKDNVRNLLDDVRHDIAMTDRQRKMNQQDFNTRLEQMASKPVTEKQTKAANALAPYVNNYEERNLKDMLKVAEESGGGYVTLPYGVTASWGQKHIQYNPFEKSMMTPLRSIKAGQTAILPYGVTDPHSPRKFIVLERKGGKAKVLAAENVLDTGEGSVTVTLANNFKSNFDGDIERGRTPAKNKALFKKYKIDKEKSIGKRSLDMFKKSSKKIYDAFTIDERKRLRRMDSDWDVKEFVREKFYTVSDYDEAAIRTEYTDLEATTELDFYMIGSIADDAEYERGRGGKDVIAEYLEKMKPDRLVRLWNNSGSDYVLGNYTKKHGAEYKKIKAEDRMFRYEKGEEKTVDLVDPKKRVFDWRTDITEKHQPIYHRYAKSIKKNSYPYILERLGIRHAMIKGSKGMPYILVPTAKETGRFIKGYDSFKSLARILPALLPFVLGLQATQEEMPEQPEKLGMQ